jgi:Transglutaminase-like superfamily
MTLDLWRHPTDLSAAGDRSDLFTGLPPGPEALAAIVQGLMMHQHIASTYGLELSGEQHAQVHIRSVEGMLDGIARHDARPLTAPREPGKRQVGVCRHFTLMHVAMLRAEGVPARARCGFAAYFQKGKFLDHWVTEYWNEGEKRWVLADAQLDAHQRKLFAIHFDPLDVPRDQFLVAGNAWTRCRGGMADPKDFGILHLFGSWLIAGNVIRDVAAINNHEMLPWDTWGAMTSQDSEIDLVFIDRLAALTLDPDAHIDDLRRAYEDQRIAVPDTVFNTVLNQPQQLQRGVDHASAQDRLP